MLEISTDKVCFLIAKAHEFDSEMELSEPDTEPGVAENEIPDDLEALEDLEAHTKDPYEEEMLDMISGLNEDEQIHLVALTWLGRGTYDEDDWQTAVQDARDAHNDKTAEYLTGIPLLGDYLEEGLSKLGLSC